MQVGFQYGLFNLGFCRLNCLLSAHMLVTILHFLEYLKTMVPFGSLESDERGWPSLIIENHTVSK
jgi:hypothetical protein